MATRTEIAALMSRLMAAFPGTKFDDVEATVDLYAERLADIPSQELAQTVNDHIDTGKWFPKVSDLRAWWVDLKAGPSNGEEAWLEVRAQIRKEGLGGDPRWSNPRIGQAARVIGWRALCDMTPENTGILHSQYLKAFSAFEERKEREMLRGPLDPRAKDLIAGVTKSLTDGS